MRVVTIVLIVAIGLSGQALAEDRVNERSALGINLTSVVDYSPEMAFVDLFKHSRPWVSQEEGQPWGKGPALELTSEGWVKRLKANQFATTLMCVAGGQPKGRYLCLYEGEGRLEFQGAAKVTKSAPGRMELEVSDHETILMHLKKTNPNDPVKNIRVIMPGHEKTHATKPFAPPFMKRTQPFRVVRFMDWMRTNDSTIVKWEDRPKLNDATQAEKGVALEYMIALCNQLGVDPWFCMPHLADDEYIKQFATMVKARLKPDLRIYIEHSNEVWNGQFAQARYAGERGRALKLSTNAYQAQLFYHSMRSVEIFRIWEKVFGDHQRFTRVLGSQSVNPWVSEQVADFHNASKEADAIAIAPYFGNSLGDPKRTEKVVSQTLDDVLKECRQQIQKNQEFLQNQAKLAKSRGLQLIAYEGGQHLVGYQGAENNEKLTKLLHAANRDPRMEQLYLEDLKAWKQCGGNLYVVFSSMAKPSKWGSWGILESEYQDLKSAPKYQAVHRFLKENPRWWKD